MTEMSISGFDRIWGQDDSDWFESIEYKRHSEIMSKMDPLPRFSIT